MRWPRRQREPDPADEALAEARAQRKEARERREEIKSIADRLREIREANHFAESIRRALGEGS
jgi:hypothetical protein